MFSLKSISRESVPRALEKAERYRLLNEPQLSESICSDILKAEPGNEKAMVTMLLSITDQFATSSIAEVDRAKQLISKLPGEYEKQYYEGIICERKGHSILIKGGYDAQILAYDWLRDAMIHYEKAELVRPPDNDDALLRWNTCARLINHYQLEPRVEESFEPPLE
jgi:hypothetical protein